MAKCLINELTVPAEQGRAWTVDKGQTMRLIAIEGSQVGDMAIFNAHDLREKYDPLNSYGANCRMGTGGANAIKYLYSHPPPPPPATEPDARNHRGQSGASLGDLW